MKRQDHSTGKKTVTSLLARLVSMLALCFMLPSVACASDNEYHFEYIDNSQGLPQNTVRSIVTDKEGYLWVGTEKGLSRYDGHRFINFSSLIEDVPEDVSLGIEVDSKNRIWTSWYTHSLRILSSNRHDVLILNPPEGFPGDLITFSQPRFMELPNGDTWFPGNQHAYRIDPENRVTTLYLGADILSRPAAVINNTIVLTEQDGLVLIDPDTEAIKRVKTPIIDLDQIHPGIKAPSDLLGTDKHILYCNDLGVFKYVFATDQATQLLGNPDTSIFGCTKHGSRLLIGTLDATAKNIIVKTLDIESASFVPNHHGLPVSVSYDNGNAHFETFVDDYNAHWLVISQSFYRAKDADSVFEDINFPRNSYDIANVFSKGHSGVIWSRTDGRGLIKISRFSRRFNTIQPPAEIALSNRIRSMVVDKDDNVWMLSGDKNLLYWNREADTWEVRLEGDTNYIKVLQILPDGSVWTILPGESRLVGYDPSTQSWRHSFEVERSSAVLSVSRDGRLMIGSDQHIYVVSPQNAKMERRTSEPIRGQMRDFIEDAESNIWVATHEEGLVRVDPKGDIQYWNPNNSDLNSAKLFDLHLAENDTLWIGTWHGGLNKLDIPNMTFTHYGRESGLPDSTVFGVLEDDTGSLWLTTYAGLVRFSPCPDTSCVPEVKVFTSLDGLQHDEFDANSHYRSERGEFFFSGMGGLNAFFPSDIITNDQPPSIKVSRAQWNQGPVPDTDSEFDFPSNIRLPFKFNVIGFEVSVLDFNQPGKNRIQFRESTGRWHELKQPVLSLRNLSDGTHRFEFRGTNNDGVWSTTPAAITLTVAPPFYRHPLMMTLYLLTAFLVPVTLLRHKQKRLIREQLVLQKKVAERTAELDQANKSREKFFANISHDISSPVHMILLMLENRMDSATGEDRNIYRSATGYAAQLMVYLKQLVRESRSHELDNRRYAVDVASVIHELVSTNSAVIQSRNLTVKIDELPHGLIAFYPYSSISIFSNLLCNAVIYTEEGGFISIKAEIKNNFYKISISNPVKPGMGVDFKRLLERGARGTRQDNEPGGHGLGLSIVTSNINMLDGKFDIVQKDEGTITFVVSLPIAPAGMPVMQTNQDFAFSYEQILSIKHFSQDTEPGADSHASKKLSGISILIVEDDEVGSRLLAKAMSEHYRVSVAGSCEKALQLIERQQPDVILSDLFLPGDSGLELLRKVRANRMSMDTFFIMMTADVSEEHRLKTQELQVDRFIRKPVSARTLQLLIDNHFALSAQRQQRQRERELLRIAKRESLKDRSVPFKERFTKALEELYHDPETTVESFQSRLAIGYYQLVKYCKRDFNQSPKRLLTRKRVTAACEMLIGSDHSIAMISELCGFTSHSQFSIVFKKETGMTPGTYRKNTRSENTRSEN